MSDNIVNVNSSETARRASGECLPTEGLSLEQRIQRLEDIVAIRNLHYQYWDALDSKDVDRFAEVFTPDFEMDWPGCIGGEMHGRETVRKNTREAFTDNVRTSHMGHQHYIEVIDGSHAIGACIVQDTIYNTATSGEFQGRAHYEIKYVKIDGRWYIERISLRYNMGTGIFHKRFGDDIGPAWSAVLIP